MARQHTTAQLLGRQDPASVSISKAEYDTLVRLLFQEAATRY